MKLHAGINTHFHLETFAFVTRGKQSRYVKYHEAKIYTGEFNGRTKNARSTNDLADMATLASFPRS